MSKVVSMTTFVSAPSSASRRRVASMPSTSGIRTSMRTTSGRRRRASSTASRPFAASPATSMSSSASRIMRKPARTSAWSSTIKTVRLMTRAGALRAIDTRLPAAGRRARRRPAAGRRVSIARKAPARVMSLTVLIVDDQALVRAGFRMILDAEEDIDVAGEAANGREAVEEARRLRPDVVLMDVRMPEVDGIEATRRLLADDGAESKVVMLNTFDMDEYVYDALRAGASGFLLKDVPPE